MSDEQYMYLGSVTPEVSRKSSLVREDKRTVTIRQSGLRLTSQGDASTLRLVDQKGKGILRSIKIVTDNPYAQLLLEIDDWRNEGETAAELLYGGTGRQDYGLYAMDGGSPAKGFTLMYTPQGGESFDGRLRISLRNRIPKTNQVFGNANEVRFGGNLPTPVINGHSGGASFSAPGFAAESLATMSKVMATPHFGEPYDSNRFNAAALGETSKVGMHNPYVGLAGKPTFTGRELTFTVSSGSIDSVNSVFVGPRAYISEGETQQTIYFTNNATDTLNTVASDLRIGEKLFIRDGGTIYFPGEITDLENHNPATGVYTSPMTLSVPLPSTDFGQIGNTGSQQLAFAVTVKPGLEVPPGPLKFIAPAGTSTEVIGTVISAAETDPVIAIKSIEIKYQLEVSYDG